MKNTMCLALIILATLPAAAQKAALPKRTTDGTDVTLASDYAAGVDGLLREIHADLQKISARMEAGELTPEQGRELKLAATRGMIARLDTLSAIYDAQLDSKHKTAAASSVAGGNSPADGGAQAALPANRTVSVEQLKREASAAAATPRAGEINR